ncbi:INO80 complex subunit D-like isoform X2 [Tubulanus polymorphus]|uniref:INO80 complex subunit D-like isoform X2 n=1 Tax=Tubulanus polymorphus TaxID=672921 RepID=UPI003DA37BB2
MFEGKNIHYSSYDNKPLCSYSIKLCKQRRLNGYAFCVRHILEDPTAPFKQCTHTTRHNKQQCNNPIPHNEPRQYCNNHMQMLGMLPKKERKKKVDAIPKESTLSIHSKLVKMGLPSAPTTTYTNANHANERQTLCHNKIKDRLVLNHAGFAFEDPYAFEDEVGVGGVASAPTPPIPAQNNHHHHHDSNHHLSPVHTKSPVISFEHAGLGAVAASKLYPELAERVSKMARADVSKSRGGGGGAGGANKSGGNSRTMNQLENRIAQNKIKDKLKRNQEVVSNCSSESQQSSPAFDSSVYHRQTSGGPTLSPPPTISLTDSPTTADPIVLPADLLNVTPSIQTMLNFAQTPNVPSGFPVVPLSPVICGGGHQVALPSVHEAPSISDSSTNYKTEDAKTEDLGAKRTKIRDLAFPMFSEIPPLATKLHLRKPKLVLSLPEQREKLKRRSAINIYKHYSERRLYNSDIVPVGLDSSSSDSSADDSDQDDVPWQYTWFTASSDDDPDSDEQEESLQIQRTTRLAMKRARIRRRYLQLRKIHLANTGTHKYHGDVTETLVAGTRDQALTTVLALRAMDENHLTTTVKNTTSQNRYKTKEAEAIKTCLYVKDDVQCTGQVLPYANHCRKHIMYNVEQQLFDYCTAKSTDNTQCCDPVFDIRHDFPLCPKHAKAIDSVPQEAVKRKRKKTKPSALTRPPKRGKKKKNQRKFIRPEKPVLPIEIFSDTGGGSSSAETNEPLDQIITLTNTAHDHRQQQPQQSHDRLTTISSSGVNDEDEDELRGVFSPETDLTLDQHESKILEDNDINDVLNKLPDDAFHELFNTGKNGDCGPSKEETDEFEKALAAVSMSKCANLICDDDELTKHITETILQQEAVSDHLVAGLHHHHHHHTGGVAGLQHAGGLQHAELHASGLHAAGLHAGAGLHHAGAGLHHPGAGLHVAGLHAGLHDDNLQALANSITETDLKNMSQVLATAEFNSVLGIAPTAPPPAPTQPVTTTTIGGDLSSIAMAKPNNINSTTISLHNLQQNLQQLSQSLNSLQTVACPSPGAAGGAGGAAVLDHVQFQLLCQTQGQLQLASAQGHLIQGHHHRPTTGGHQFLQIQPSLNHAVAPPMYGIVNHSTFNSVNQASVDSAVAFASTNHHPVAAAPSPCLTLNTVLSSPSTTATMTKQFAPVTVTPIVQQSTSSSGATANHSPLQSPLPNFRNPWTQIEHLNLPVFTATNGYQQTNGGVKYVTAPPGGGGDNNVVDTTTASAFQIGVHPTLVTPATTPKQT